MMKRKLIITGLLLLGGLWLAKKTSLCSYASVLWAKVKSDVKEQVPTQVELERVRLEIASMDKDISNMLRPIAEQMATINRLKKDMQNSQAKLTEQKTTLLTMTKD